MNTDLVRKGYNLAASVYAKDRSSLRSGKYLNKFIQLLKSSLPAGRLGADILDIGCGDGVPIDLTLLKKGHLVTGIDLSKQQITLARRNCPTGDFAVKDMQNLESGEYSVDGVVSFYAIFHIPRTRHLEILKKINSFLPKGGLMLITMGDRDFEGIHDFYGVKMWSSHYRPQKNRQLIEQAGFEILLDEIDKSAREKHQILIARKK